MAIKSKCDQCGREFEFYEVRNGVCQTCSARTERLEHERLEHEIDFRRAKMLVTTEMSVNLPITQRLGIVGSQCALGVNIFKDIFIAGRDFWGGRSDTIQSEIELGRETVIREMVSIASRLGADGVIAVSITFSEFSGGGGRMIFIAASGTAVRIGQES